jgi:exopolyphosphatase/guanosine-5'-triphosphate,3'-diphosphate pyrophosphatase
MFSSAEEGAAPHLPQRSGIGHGRAIIGRENSLPDSRELHTAFNRRTVGEGTLSPVAKKLAAIDVGTNSIKVLVASIEEDGAFEVLAREKEMVRLGTETLFTGHLSEEAIEAGVSAIERLVKEARSAGAEEIRAVATCALREASNARDFQAAVLRRTGVSVDVISGEEEARLIHLAARSEFPRELDPLLVLDIGGGSSELIVSRGERVLLSESIPMGVVRLAAGRSRTDPPNKEDIRRMKKAIRAVAHRAVRAVRRTGFRACAGSSGTIQSLSLVYEAAVRGREPRTGGHRTLTRDGLKKVNRILRTTTMREKLRVAGLDPKRRDISVPGGVLLAWILKNVGADAIVVGERGLREGLLLDYVARHGRARFGTAGRDVRSRSVDRLLRRSNALLHDVGYAVGRAKHNRHSYYLITHGDLTGFAAEEIEVLASIARYHRGKCPKDSHENWRALDPLLRPVVEKLSAILRIADAFDRSHEQLIVGVNCRVRGDRVEFEAVARADCEAELTAARKKANLFENVFGRRAVFRAVSDEQREPLHQRNLEMVSAEALWS